MLHDPFGLRVLLHHEVYAAPNRFFAHFFLHEYFRHVPLWLQAFLSPINSVYVACALVKLAVHLLLVYGLAVAASNCSNVLNWRFLLAAVLTTPLLQASGYYGQMGIVDQSITYACFYALPMSLLLVFFLPFVRAALHGPPVRLSWPSYLALAALAVVLAFNGPTVAATALLVCSGSLPVAWHRRYAALPTAGALEPRAWRAFQEISPGLLWPFVWIIGLSLYSMYIGRNNSENLWATIPLAERYIRLAQGMVYQLVGSELVTGDYRLASRFGLPLLLGAVLLNAWLGRRWLPTPQRATVLSALKWLGVFALVYLLLLPLGGYRSYRAYVVRRDTILPITLGLVGLFTLSTYWLLVYLPPRGRLRYAGAVLVLLAVFTVADKHRISNTNAGERRLLSLLSQSEAPVVALPADCNLMDWQPLTDYRKSELNSRLFHHWRITKTRKLYYQR
ncbi:hypothetical protein Q5H92_25130 [Hymenobacter sp. M29]|uniref:Glycosyltransferase RgtA/B/C/D-like domain-containing protein n=1 Tax=Hymenobacter mellowenesis TaxID=3063995 RepID=A0ABT9AIH1_9BACT|nr:hypothetical protein [Hymenobacter sp. M29]MDO7849671.1 hypothetical protein [Hymenobacter sp. M29]